MLDVRFPMGFDIGSAGAALLAQLCLHRSVLSLRSYACLFFFKRWLSSKQPRPFQDKFGPRSPPRSLPRSTCFANQEFALPKTQPLLAVRAPPKCGVEEVRKANSQLRTVSECPVATPFCFAVAGLPPKKWPYSTKPFHTVAFCKGHSGLKAESIQLGNSYNIHTFPALLCFTCCVPMGLFPFAIWYVSHLTCLTS